MKLGTDYHEAMEQVSRHFNEPIANCILHTTMTYEEFAEEFGLETKYVQRLATKRGINRPKGSGSPAHPKHKAPQGLRVLNSERL
jgi:hypothetical protein